MAILTFKQKHDFWKRPFILSTQNLLCIEYGHLDLSRHDLGKALLFFPSKIYSTLYVHPDFRTNFNMSTCTCILVIDMKVLAVLKYLLKK